MILPMLASLGDAPLDDPGFVYEPKYDGIRAIVNVDAPRPGSHLVAAWQREDRPVSGNRRCAEEVVGAPCRAGCARRRNRRARCEGPPGRIPAAPGTHPLLEPSREPGGGATADGAHRVRPAGSRPQDPPRQPLVERRAALEQRLRAHDQSRSFASANSSAATAARSTSARWRKGGRG